MYLNYKHLKKKRSYELQDCILASQDVMLQLIRSILNR